LADAIRRQSAPAGLADERLVAARRGGGEAEAHLPERSRSALQQQALLGRRRGGEAGHALEDRNREQLYELAKKKDIKGRSKMGKWELIEAIRKAG
jgi:hypothetical protein